MGLGNLVFVGGELSIKILIFNDLYKQIHSYFPNNQRFNIKINELLLYRLKDNIFYRLQLILIQYRILIQEFYRNEHYLNELNEKESGALHP